MTSQNFLISSDEAMQDLGSNLAKVCLEKMPSGGVVFFHGDLGVGKTTFIRGFIRQMGHKGSVKSPTYTLVEPYDLGEHRVFHFDFYRIYSPLECEEMGIRDYLEQDAYCLIEWPEKAGSFLPVPDVTINININQTNEREVAMMADKEPGLQVLSRLKEVLA